MNLLTRRTALFVLAAIPFVLVPVASAWSVRPLAQLGARWCNLAFAALSSGADSAHTPAAEEEGTPREAADPATSPGSLSHEPRAPLPHAAGGRNERSAVVGPGVFAARRPSARRARPTVFVGPESVKRAIPVGGRPTSSWTNSTVEHPAGLLIQSPGALGGVIEPGDILVEAEGQALRSFEQLIVTVRQAYERRVTRLSGRLFRRGDLVPVTVEPGW